MIFQSSVEQSNVCEDHINLLISWNRINWWSSLAISITLIFLSKYFRGIQDLSISNTWRLQWFFGLWKSVDQFIMLISLLFMKHIHHIDLSTSKSRVDCRSFLRIVYCCKERVDLSINLKIILIFWSLNITLISLSFRKKCTNPVISRNCIKLSIYLKKKRVTGS